jgi:DNA-binding NarL/FixJ family response regulator
VRLLRVVIVDDHPMFRLGLAAAVEQMEGVELVGEAERAADVAALVSATQPDVVLLDIRLPDGSGLEVNRSLATDHPDVRVIVLTMSEDHENVVTALRDGARGYLVKGAGPDQVELAIRAVAADDVVLNAELAQALSQVAHARARTTVSRPFPDLTRREHDVLELIAEGLDNQSIARRLVLNPKTVRNHITNVLAKLHAADRSQAIVLARRAGLGGENASSSP